MRMVSVDPREQGDAGRECSDSRDLCADESTKCRREYTVSDWKYLEPEKDEELQGRRWVGG